MIATDEDALICDLAETYSIYGYRSLPVKTVAALSVGLRENSRIKLKLSGQKYPLETYLQAMMVDSLQFLCWLNTKDGQEGINRPKRVLDVLLDNKQPKQYMSFDSLADFEAKRQEIIKRLEHG